MGNFAASLRDDGSAMVGNSSHPMRPDWITAHATTSQLAIVEVERLWSRFRQLGATKDGVLENDAFISPLITQDVFMKNILNTLRRPPDGLITFQAFLNAMKWVEMADSEMKLKGMFNLLNNGNPLKKDILGKLLKRIYTEESDANIQKTAETLMSEMDPQKQGYITEAQFTTWANKMPKQTLDRILDFHIVPMDINVEAHRSFSTLSKYTTQLSQRGPATAGSQRPEPNISQQVPSDSVLQQIASLVFRRDWHVLANRLGFTEIVIKDFEMRFSQDKQEQVFQMLKEWRHKEGSNATAGVLETALHDSKMNDAAMVLYP